MSAKKEYRWIGWICFNATEKILGARRGFREAKKCAAQGFKCVRKDMCEGMETSDADRLFIGLKFLLLLHLLSV